MEKVQVNVIIDKDLHERLAMICDLVGCTQRDAVSAAISAWTEMARIPEDRARIVREMLRASKDRGGPVTTIDCIAIGKDGS